MGKPKFNLTGKNGAVKVEKKETEEKKDTIDLKNPLSALSKTAETKNWNLETKLIPRRLLKKNPKNKAPMTQIDALAESILHYGLQQPITVVYATAEDEYIIETGHRRTTALDMLIEKYAGWEKLEDDDYKDYVKNVKPYENGYPCIIKERLDESVNYETDAESEEELDAMPEDLLMSEIRVLITNNQVRSESDPENQAYKQYEVSRLAQLYSSINRRRGKKDKINVNEQVAKDMNLTARQVIKYKNVEKLIPELKEAFASNHITLTEANSFRNLSEEEQRMIVDMLEQGRKLQADEAKQLTAEKKNLEEQMQSREKEIAQKTEAYRETLEKYELEKKKALEEIEALKSEQDQKAAELREELRAEVKAEEEAILQNKLNNLEKEYSGRQKDLQARLDEREQAVKQAADQIKELEEAKQKSEQHILQSLEKVKAETALSASYDDAVNSLRRFSISVHAYQSLSDDGKAEELVRTLITVLETEVN